MGNNVVVPDRQPFDWMDYVRLDATVQTILQQSNVNFKDNVATVGDLPSTWNTVDDFRLVLQNGFVYKRDWSQWGQISVNNFTRFINWEVNNEVQSITIMWDYLYIWWVFTFVWTLAAQRIARYNLVTGVRENIWNMNGAVSVLRSVGIYVYAWGAFTTVWVLTVNRIARYNTLNNTREAFTSGGWTWCSWNVNALVVDGNNLYVWWQFATSWGIATGKIAKFDLISNIWSSLGTWITWIWIFSNMIINAWFLYIWGNIWVVDWVVATWLARYNISWATWSAIWGWTNWNVNWMQIYNNNLYAVGWFSLAWAIPVNSFAKFDLIWLTWSAISTGIVWSVACLALDGDTLYFWWNISFAGGKSIVWVAGYDIWTWEFFPIWTTLLGSQSVLTIYVSSPYLYIGWQFTSMDSTNRMPNLARYDLTTNNRS